MKPNEESTKLPPFLVDLSAALRKKPPEIPDERLLKGLAGIYWSLGRISESLACLRLIERREELCAPESRIKGYWQLYLGDSEGARKSFERAMSDEPTDPATRLGYAFALFYIGDYEAAARAFQTLADEGAPLNSPPVMAKASSIMAACGRPEGVMMAPLPGLPEGVADVLQLRLLHGLPHAIDGARERLQTIAPEERLPLQRLLADLYLDSDQTNQSLKLLSELLGADAADGATLYLLGIALRRAGGLEESRDAFLNSITLAPLEARAWAGFAACCLELGETEKCVDYYRVAIFLDDANPMFWSDLGAAEGHLKHYEQCREALDRAIRLGHRNFANYFNRGVSSLCLGEADAALADLQSAIAFEPDHPRVAEAESLMKELGYKPPDDPFVFGEIET